MKWHHIGSLPCEDFGHDAYYLLTLQDEDVPELATCETQDFVHSKFLERVYHNTHTPGRMFCTSVLVSPKQYSDTEFIGIAQVRYDV